MTEPAFNVKLDTSGDPVRAEFRWSGELDTEQTTRFAVWIKSQPDVHQNALLAVERSPDGMTRTYRHQFKPRHQLDCGQVVEMTDGRLVAEFPREVLAAYGPTFSWWGLLSVGENDRDTCSPEDSFVNLTS
ncbi:hypothetical protein LWF15_06935 [Kineosporia rhizophila]|uniref:hypothetical protein n=1 Tax=Kineosporia TaxID=49184 RepID=UPI000B2282C1|nr:MULTISPECIES: hypothetical protein [Kineosporia]MCE0535238.1 hypothetical protein [Kineosporia rhizophila]GLY16986.1 hypothetical protein Kisp01_40010 [Kineosporia sp. NBRC 101677]